VNPDNERKLQQRIAQVGNSALARAGYVTAVDMPVGIGWLDPGLALAVGRGRRASAARSAASAGVAGALIY
jgi:hypothetical protein